MNRALFSLSLVIGSCWGLIQEGWAQESIEDVNADIDLSATMDPVILPHPLVAIDDETFLAFGGITGWGIVHWGWFTEPQHIVDEGGFSADSSTGGADKTGHFYMSYLLAELMTARLERQGYTSAQSALWGATSAMALMTWLEVGDGTGPYGFSVEDLVADFLGVTMSWVKTRSPAIGRVIDFRTEYWPTPGALEGNDIAADYTGMRHLMAIQLAGVPYVSQTPLHLIDLQVGYYSRGFRTFDEPELQAAPVRSLYMGVGLNVAEFLRGEFPERDWMAFHYYQTPLVSFEVASRRWE